ncbi:hypothetical protein ACC691_37015, partial [Rhizobium johnstonii]
MTKKIQRQDVNWEKIPPSAGWALMRSYHEVVHKRRHRIDYAGAASLTVGLTLVILGLLEGGHAWAWGSLPSIGCFVVGAAALVAFAMIERRAAEPILDLSLFSRRLILTT